MDKRNQSVYLTFSRINERIKLVLKTKLVNLEETIEHKNGAIVQFVSLWLKEIKAFI